MPNQGDKGQGQGQGQGELFEAEVPQPKPTRYAGHICTCGHWRAAHFLERCAHIGCPCKTYKEGENNVK